MTVQFEKIRCAYISGDFFSKRDVREIENALISIPYTREAIRSALGAFAVGEYLCGVTADELLSILI